LEDDGGNAIGGVTGYSRWGWLFLASVAVPAELRGQGWGRRLIAAAETTAAQRGCRYVWFDTYSFQARPFYEKLGYQVFGQLPDHPPGHTRFFMFKTLRSDPT
jgi:GNAT superfamily N-acetyltransferase